MELLHKPYYCYLEKGVPTILEDKPEDFANLPYPYQTHCPNLEIAKLAYQTNLRIMQWRSIES